jgi:hypothetical protein
MASGVACNRTAKNEGKGDPGTDPPAVTTPDGKRAAVRFDGLYCSKVRPKLAAGEKLKAGESVPQFYRFYENGTFVNTAAIGEPHEVAEWIRPGMAGLVPAEGDGVYVVQGNLLKLNFPNHPAHDPTGDEWLEWVGTIEGDEIEMEWYRNTKSPPTRKLLRKERLEFVSVKFGHN